MLSRSETAEGSSECASSPEHRFKARVHLFLFDKLATLGSLNTFFYGSEKSSLFVEEMSDDIHHESLRIGAGLAGHTRDLLLLLGCEMNFHGFQGTNKPHW